MVTTLAIDVGSSSVKAAVLVGTRPVSALVREGFATRYDGVRAEVDPREILRAVGKAARGAVHSSVGKPVEVVAMSAMSPSWIAVDRKGEALTPVVTHQDRRSVHEARRIEAEFGKEKHLAITGNRPVPGGISSTTAAWFARHEKGTMRRSALVGHVQTYLLHVLTGARAADRSNASFMGVYKTTEMPETDADSGWHEGLVKLAGLKLTQMPHVLSGDTVAGELTSRGARMLGLRSGTPVLTGVVDTSAAVVLAGALPGMLVNVSGSTDVLAVVTETPRPDERYLTRGLGVGRKWLSVSTISAAGSAVAWARRALFSELEENDFYRVVAKVSAAYDKEEGSSDGATVEFLNGLAGSRVAVEQPTGRFEGLRLSTTREEMLAAVIRSLAKSSAERLDLLKEASSHRIRREVLRTGGTGGLLARILYARWPTVGGSNGKGSAKGRHRRPKYLFSDIPEATLLGLGQLAQGRPV